jgi:hypothetical protein
MLDVGCLTDVAAMIVRKLVLLTGKTSQITRNTFNVYFSKG